MDDTSETLEPKGVCPYCGSNQFQNSWGYGNACCVSCGREFNVRFRDGQMVGVPVHQLEDN